MARDEGRRQEEDQQVAGESRRTQRRLILVPDDAGNGQENPWIYKYPPYFEPHISSTKLSKVRKHSSSGNTRFRRAESIIID